MDADHCLTIRKNNLHNFGTGRINPLICQQFVRTVWSFELGWVLMAKRGNRVIIKTTANLQFIVTGFCYIA